MTTRVVTGLFKDPNGDPLAGFPLTFRVPFAQYQTDAHYPVSAVNLDAEMDGTISITLVAGIVYEVGLRGSFQRLGSSTMYPEGSQFRIVVPNGAGSISLEMVRGLGGIAPNEPDVKAMIEQVVADYLTDHDDIAPHTHPISDVLGLQGDLDDKADDTALTSHTTDTTNPHSVTATQTGAYTSGEADLAIDAVRGFGL